MEIKDLGKNLIPTLDVTCGYEKCGATVVVKPHDVINFTEGWRTKYMYKCPCCGHGTKIPREKFSSEFSEEMDSLRK